MMLRDSIPVIRAMLIDGQRWMSGTDTPPSGLDAQSSSDGWRCRFDAGNAAILRSILSSLRPVAVGQRRSIGCGDRLGHATPGHLDAVQGGGMFPVLAQQSIREMGRAGRTPQQVMDDVVWGVLLRGHTTGWGCDADHLKTTQAIDTCIDAGFIGFTLDPGEVVDNAAHTDDAAALEGKFTDLPWDRLSIAPDAVIAHYRDSALPPPIIIRAFCKYGRAIAHVVMLSQHITSRLGATPYDLEISIDETDTPTSPAEHYLIASELIRLGVPFTGLAPRFIGAFEKGVDYRGDLMAFEYDFAAHARIRNHFGSYKLSIHSGSDKFSLYPIIARHAGEHVHLKTAGTSWLEALRVIAACEPLLFRAMLTCAVSRYPSDKVSYHVSAHVERVDMNQPDVLLPAMLDQHDARQILHVTFGSLLADFRVDIDRVLIAHSDTYHEGLRRHFARHIAPFTEG